MPLTFARAHQSVAPHCQPFIVVADDVDAFRSVISGTFRRVGFFVEEAKNSTELFDLITANAVGDNARFPDLIVTTACLVGSGGLGLLLGIQAQKLGIPLIMLNRSGDSQTQVLTPSDGEITLSSRPFTLSDLCVIARELLDHAASPTLLQDPPARRVNPARGPRQEFDGILP